MTTIYIGKPRRSNSCGSRVLIAVKGTDKNIATESAVAPVSEAMTKLSSFLTSLKDNTNNTVSKIQEQPTAVASDSNLIAVHSVECLDDSVNDSQTDSRSQCKTIPSISNVPIIEDSHHSKLSYQSRVEKSYKTISTLPACYRASRHLAVVRLGKKVPFVNY